MTIQTGNSMQLVKNIDYHQFIKHVDCLEIAPGIPVPVDESCSGREHSQYKEMRLDKADLDRIVLYENFKIYTKNESKHFRLSDIRKDRAENKDSERRIMKWVDNPEFDLRSESLWEKVSITIVTTNEKSGPLFIMDGNHRLCAQFINHKCFHDVRSYVMINPCIQRKWLRYFSPFHACN